MDSYSDAIVRPAPLRTWPAQSVVAPGRPARGNTSTCADLPDRCGSTSGSLAARKNSVRLDNYPRVHYRAHQKLGPTPVAQQQP